jgi:hypothetical protein
MKNLIKYILVFVIGGVFLSSCEEEVSNWNAMTKDYDANNTTYYVQFLNATASYETAIDEAGLPTDIVATIGVALLGAPQSSDINVSLVVDPSSTISENMYSLSSSSIIIPAGSTSGSVTLTTVADEMPEDEALKLVLNMDAGGAEATSAFQLNYTLKRIKFCPWVVDDMVGSYSGSDFNGYAGSGASGYSFEVFKLDDTHIEVAGMGQHLYSAIWGEVVTAGDRVVIQVNPNGTMEFENQFLCTTDDVWDYYMGPGGGDAKWDGCNMTFTIPWIWHWDDAYGDAYECLSVFTKQ